MNPSVFSMIFFAVAIINVFLIFATTSVVFSILHFIIALWFIYRASELQEQSKHDDSDHDEQG